jgi:hypothetical protein
MTLDDSATMAKKYSKSRRRPPRVTSQTSGTEQSVPSAEIGTTKTGGGFRLDSVQDILAALPEITEKSPDAEVGLVMARNRPNSPVITAKRRGGLELFTNNAHVTGARASEALAYTTSLKSMPKYQVQTRSQTRMRRGLLSVGASSNLVLDSGTSFPNLSNQDGHRNLFPPASPYLSRHVMTALYQGDEGSRGTGFVSTKHLPTNQNTTVLVEFEEQSHEPQPVSIKPETDLTAANQIVCAIYMLLNLFLIFRHLLSHEIIVATFRLCAFVQFHDICLLNI